MHKEKPRAEVLIRWRGVVDGSALIESHFPVSRALSSSNYILFSPPVLASFALFFLFWLGPAPDHSVHTPTTTPFQYLLLYLYYAQGAHGNQYGDALDPCTCPQARQTRLQYFHKSPQWGRKSILRHRCSSSTR